MGNLIYIPETCYCAEANALFARMSEQPSKARKTLICKTIKALKAAGIWGKLDAAYFLAGHNQSDSLLNIVQNAYNLTPIDSPAFTIDQGWQGNASTQYLKTGFVPSVNGVNFTLYHASIGLVSNTQSVNDGFSMGSASSGSTDETGIVIGLSGVSYFNVNSAQNEPNAVNSVTKGFFIANRNNNGDAGTVNDVSGYHNADPIYESGILHDYSATGLSTNEIIIMGFYNGTYYAQDNRQFSFAFIGGGFTNMEVIAFTQIIKDYLDAIGLSGVVSVNNMLDNSYFTNGFSLTDASGYDKFNSFVQYKFKTNATEIILRANPTAYEYYPDYCKIAIAVNGVDNQIVAYTKNEAITVTLPAGTDKIITLTESYTQIESALLPTIHGIFINGLIVTGGDQRPITNSYTNKILFVGDSILNGLGVTDIFYDAIINLAREDGYDIALLGYGGGSVYQFARTPAYIVTVSGWIDSLMDGSISNKLFIEIGINDWSNSLESTTDFATYYGDLLDAIHTLRSDIDIHVINLIITNLEATVYGGYILQDFRDAITTLCGTRSGWVTLIDGKSILEVTDLDDGVHPTTSGEVVLYNAIKTYF